MTAAYQPSRAQEPKPSEMRRFTTPGSLEQETLRKENDQLRTALVTRIVIEQAKGMLAERLTVEVDEAFERLRREARNRRMKLHTLAEAVIAREAWTESAFHEGDPGTRRNGPAVHARNGFSSPTTLASPTGPPKDFDRRSLPD